MALGSNGVVEHSHAGVLSFDSDSTACISQGIGTVNICADNGFFVNGINTLSLLIIVAVCGGVLAAVIIVVVIVLVKKSTAEIQQELAQLKKKNSWVDSSKQEGLPKIVPIVSGANSGDGN